MDKANFFKRVDSVSEQRIVNLTFDDGPHRIHTPIILDILKRHEISACFFVLGEEVVASHGVQILERMKCEGHQIGNHSYDHSDLHLLTEPQIRSQLELTHCAILNIYNKCKFFRPPYGNSNPLVRKLISEYNYDEIMWNVDTEDWRRKENGSWVEYGLKQINNRVNSTVILHDIHKSTVEHLDRFIGEMKKQGDIRFENLDCTATP